jgi:hypothetical protein
MRETLALLPLLIRLALMLPRLMRKSKTMLEIFAIAQAVPALITVAGNTVTAYTAATTTQEKLSAIAAGLQAALDEVQTVLKDMA